MDWLLFLKGVPVWPVDSSPISRQCKCKKDTISIQPRSSVVTTAVSSNAIGRLCKLKTQKPVTVTITQYNIFLSIFLSWSCIHNEAGHFTKCTNFNFNYNIIWTSRTESREHFLFATDKLQSPTESSIKKEQPIFTVQKLAQFSYNQWRGSMLTGCWRDGRPMSRKPHLSPSCSPRCRRWTLNAGGSSPRRCAR